MNKDFIPLVKAAGDGSESALEELYNMTKEMSYFMALSITHNGQDALAIMQESYFKAFSNLKALKSPEMFDNRLFRIVSNTVKNHIMRKNPMLFESISDEAMYEIKDEQNSDLVPHEFVDKEETSRLIMEIINKLSEEKRLVILMYYYQEMSTTEIAETLEMPLATVKYKLLVARREIKEELEKLDRNGTRLHAALPLTVLTSVFSNAAQGVNAPAFSAISQSVSGTPATVGTTTGTAGIDTAKTRGISTIFKTTMAKVIAAVLALAVVGGGVTAAVIISKNNSSHLQTVYEKNDKDESSYNGSKDSGGDSSDLSEESEMPEIPETPASDFEYTIENDVVIIIYYTGSDAQVRIPEKIEGKPVTEIEAQAFYDCESLTSVDIPATVTEIGAQAFLNCTRLTDINVSSDNPLYSSQGGVLFNKDKTTLVCYPAGKENTSYSIPNSVTYISDYFLSNCTSLTSVDIPNSVTEIGKYAFSYIESVTISDTAEIEVQGFLNCTRRLTDINVSSDNPLYSSQDGVLFNKDKTTLICYPSGKENTSYSISNSVTEIGKNAFDSCTNLTSIEIPNSVTKIGEFAFFSCKNLTSVDIPNSVTEIGEGALSCCYSLTSVDIPNSVTEIGNDAFHGCYSLKNIEIPNSITEIGESAFFHCYSLTSVDIPNSVTKIGPYAFGYDNLSKKISNFTIYGKAGSAAETYANNNGFTFKTN